MSLKHLRYKAVKRYVSEINELHLATCLSEAICFIIENGLEDQLRKQREFEDHVVHFYLSEVIEEVKKLEERQSTGWIVTI